MPKIIILLIISLIVVPSDHEMVGKATWYGVAPFLGNRTPSGIICDGVTPQAAHKTLPFGTVVDVTNLKNGRKIRVIITDRGPYVKGRILDLNPKWLMDNLCGKKCGMANVELKILDTWYSCKKFRCLSKQGFGLHLDEDEIKMFGLTWPPR